MEMITVLDKLEIKISEIGSKDFENNIKSFNIDRTLDLHKRDPKTFIYNYIHTDNKHKNEIFIKYGAFSERYIYIPSDLYLFDSYKLNFLIRKLEAYSMIIHDLKETENSVPDILSDRIALLTYTELERKYIIQNIFSPMRTMLKEDFYNEKVKYNVNDRLINIFIK